MWRRFLLCVACVCCVCLHVIAEENHDDNDRLIATAVAEQPQYFSALTGKSAVISETFKYRAVGDNDAEHRTVLRLHVKIVNALGTTVRTLGNEVAAAVTTAKDDRDDDASATTTVSAMWDGKDEAAHTVPDGKYTYKAWGELVRIRLDDNKDDQSRKTDRDDVKRGHDAGHGDVHGDDGPREHIEAISNVLGGLITMDSTPPTIKTFAPTNGAFINVKRPTISGTYADSGSGIDTTAVSVTLDGQAVKIVVGASSCSFVPASDLAEGNHTVTLLVKDLAGNSSTEAWTFFIDTVQPIISGALPPNATFTNNHRPAIGATFSDAQPSSGINLASAQVLLDTKNITGAATVGAAGFTYSPASDLPEGPHMVNAAVSDNAGNVASLAWSFTTDYTPPLIGSLTPANGSFVVVKRPAISASYSDALSGIAAASVSVSLDGNPVTVAATRTGFSFTPTADLAEGWHALVLSVADVAGNIAVAQWNFFVDTVPPVVSAAAPADGSFTNSRRQTVSAVFSDPAPGSGVNPAAVQILADGADISAACSITAAGFTYSPTADWSESAHNITARISDFATNTTTFSWSFTSDYTPPVIANTSPMPYSRTNTPTVSATISDNLSGVDPASVQVFIDGTITSAVGTPTGVSFTTAPLADGQHTAMVLASDRATNQATSVWSFFVDTVPPMATLSPARNSFTNKAQPTFSATYSDPVPSSGINAEGIVATSDGAIITNQLTPNPDPLTSFAFTPNSNLSEGTHLFSAMIPDNAGNAVTVTTSIIVDLTPPSISGQLPINGSYVTSTRPAISATYSDNLSGVNVQSVSVTLDGNPVAAQFTASGFSFVPSANLAQGDHQVAVTIADNAGNSANSTWTFTVDSIPPTISNLVPSSGTRTNVQQPVFSATFADNAGGSGVNAATFALALDGTDVTSAAQLSVSAQAPITATGFSFQPSAPLPEGTHTLTVSIADFAENLSTASTTVTIDITPPAPPVADTITIDQTTATFIGSTEPDVVGIIANIDGAQLDYAKIGSWSAHVTKTTSDTFTLTVQLVDAAGNVSLPSTFVETFLPQTNPITISKFEALQPKVVQNGGFYFNSTQVDFVAEATGGQGPLTVTIGDQSGANNADQFTGTLTLPEGQNQVTATVSDGFGNTQSQTITVVVDLTPPVLTIDTLTDNSADTQQNPITSLTTSPLGFLYLNGLASGQAVRQDSTLPRNVFSANNFGIQGEVTDALSGVAANIHVDVREIDALSGDITYPFVDYAGALGSEQLDLNSILAQPALSPQSQDFSVTAAPVQGGDPNRVTFSAASIAQGLKDSLRTENNVPLSKIYFCTITATDLVGNSTTVNFWAKVDTTAPSQATAYTSNYQFGKLSGVNTGDGDVVRVYSSDDGAYLRRAVANGPWLFTDPKTQTTTIYPEDLAGNVGQVQVQFTQPNPIPFGYVSPGSYDWSDFCLHEFLSASLAGPTGGPGSSGGPGGTGGPSAPWSPPKSYPTFTSNLYIDGNNYVEMPPSWDTQPRQHTLTGDASFSGFPTLQPPGLNPVLASFVLGGFPNINRPYPDNSPVPAPPGSAVFFSTINAQDAINSQNPGQPVTKNYADFASQYVPGWNSIGAYYDQGWQITATDSRPDGVCKQGPFSGGPAVITESWFAMEDATYGGPVPRRVIAYKVVPETVAANAGNHVYIRGYFGDNYKIGDAVSVSFKADGGQGTVMIISDPTEPPSATGNGHIIADDLQNFTAVQTVDVLLADSPDVSGVFDVLVDSRTLPRLVRFVQMQWLNHEGTPATASSVLSATDLVPYLRNPGQPGGINGFGGPPTGTGFKSYQDPFRIEALTFGPTNQNGLSVISCQLNSNVSDAFTNGLTGSNQFTLTQLSRNSSAYVSDTGDLGLMVLSEPSGSPTRSFAAYVVNPIFGFKGSKTFFESAPNSGSFSTKRIQIVLTLNKLNDSLAPRNGTVSIYSNIAGPAGITQIGPEPISESGIGTNVFYAPDGLTKLTLLRITSNGSSALNDLTTLITNPDLDIESAAVDAIETGLGSLTFRTDLLKDPDAPLTGGNAIAILKQTYTIKIGTVGGVKLFDTASVSVGTSTNSGYTVLALSAPVGTGSVDGALIGSPALGLSFQFVESPSAAPAVNEIVARPGDVVTATMTSGFCTGASTKITVFKISVDQINFNGPGNVNLSVDGTNSIGTPTGGAGEDIEWKDLLRDKPNTNKSWTTAQSAPAAYISGNPLTADVRFVVEPASMIKSFNITGRNGGSYGDFIPQDVITSGASGNQTFSTDSSSTIKNINVEDLTFTWQLNSVTLLNGTTIPTTAALRSTTHRVYTLYATPLAPMAKPWLPVLELACGIAKGKGGSATGDVDIVNEMTHGIYFSTWRTFAADAHFINPQAVLVYDPTLLRSAAIAPVPAGNPPAPQKLAYAVQEYDLVNFLSFLSQPEVRAQCNDNSNLFNVLLHSVGVNSSSIWFAHQSPPWDLPTDLMVTATYQPAGPVPVQTSNFTFHQIGQYNGKVYDPSTSKPGAPEPTKDITFAEYLDSVFPGQSTAGVETQDVTSVVIGNIPVAPISFVSIDPSSVPLGASGVSVDINGAGFDSFVSVRIVESGTDNVDADGVSISSAELISPNIYQLKLNISASTTPRNVDILCTKATQIFNVTTTTTRLTLKIGGAP